MQRRQFSPLLALVALVGTHVNAQGTNATCQSSFDWMTNSRGQSPCLVTAYLNTPCLSNAADAYVYSLPSGFHYRPPLVSTATACQCNTVFYSVIQACAVCQGDPIVPWSTWNQNCTAAIYESVYPEPIPSGTAVPAWAFLDVTVSDNFNASAAQLNEETNPAESSASSVAALPTNSPTVGGPLPTHAAAASHSGSPVGAIVGGVVGGVVGLAILAAIGIFFWRRRGRSSAARTSAASNIDMTGGEYPAVSQVYTPIPVFPASPPPVAEYVSPGRIYDPNDPSTFPTGMDESLHSTQQILYSPSSPPPVSFTSNQPEYQQQHVVAPQGHYTGVAEV
ncbi:hypothetical protein EUX98_g6170 [Antrodiella citrinella]|uniref:Transmembrane protein n=1 Tax=Antrodiella citrinella TaxID=2447956 RepID=A0A4S4MPM8_9APHY|nr:hypothetical protein EUX98_g6170 [Antrodiella citrinella]